MTSDPLLTAHHLTKTYPVEARSLFAGRRWLRAVGDVSFTVRPREIFAIIGESGSGKSTLTRLLVGLESPTSGHVELAGRHVGRNLSDMRSQVQIVFQDPYSSLDPRLRIGTTIREPLISLGYKGNLDERVRAMLEAVGLPSGAERKLPHEFSGGQLQRIAIARALAPDPAVIVADEPLSALDVSVQGQVLNLLLDLRDERGLTIVLVAHDLAVVFTVADRVAVMFGGRLVELGGTDEMAANPRHPYTQQLLRSVLRMDGVLPEDDPRGVDEPIRPGGGSLCPYRARCPVRIVLCDQVDPPLGPASRDGEPAVSKATGGPSDHLVACHVAPRTTPHPDRGRARSPELSAEIIIVSTLDEAAQTARLHRPVANGRKRPRPVPVVPAMGIVLSRADASNLVQAKAATALAQQVLLRKVGRIAAEVYRRRRHG